MRRLIDIGFAWGDRDFVGRQKCLGDIRRKEVDVAGAPQDIGRVLAVIGAAQRH